MDAKEIIALRKLAMEATEGEWESFIGAKSSTFAVGIKDKSVDQVVAWSGFDGSHESKKKQRANCKYIVAAQPQLMIKLLDELQACQLRLAKIETKCQGVE